MAKHPFVVRPLDIGEPVGGNALSNRGVTHLAKLKYTGMIWQSDGNADLWVRGTFGSAQEVDFCALLAANAQAGTTIRLRLGSTQAEVDGTAPYDSTPLPFIDPSRTREDGLYHSHLEIDTPVSATWWRIDIGGHTGDFEASGLVLGKKRTASRFYNRDFEYGFEDLGGLEIARNGVVSEVPGSVLRTLLFRLAWVSEAEYFSHFEPLLSGRGARQLVYWCFDPESSEYRQDKSYLGYFGRLPFARGADKAKVFVMDFQLRALL